MRIILTAGGTGGHIYPALAVLDTIKKDKHNEYLYIGTKDRMESDLIPSLNIPYNSLEIYGLNKNIIKDFKNIKCVFKSIKQSKNIIKEFKPDAVIAFGGYVTLPVIIAAKKLKVKTYIHEQNYIPGKVNKYLSKYADAIFISFEETKKYFKNKNTIYTGNPCSERAKTISPIDKTTLGFTKDKKLILIVMGSMGSSVVNDKLKEFLQTYEEQDKEILFITGKKLYENFKNLKVPKSTKIMPYLENLSGLMKQADLIISRAGASTISEILALDLPSILIPSPYVANNHQYYNALDLDKKGVSKMLEQTELNSETLKSTIKEILDDKKTYLEYKDKLKSIAKIDSSTKIYNYIKQNL